MMLRHRRQLAELLTNYGQIDMVCLDMFLDREAWPALRETMLDLRPLQPDVMFRAGASATTATITRPRASCPAPRRTRPCPGW